MNPANHPIGIFDSGVGGLTVLKEIQRILPHEDTIYLGDTARVPYGSKSPQTVIKYSLENTIFLTSKKIKALVVACNSSSSVSLDRLRNTFKLPIISVIEPVAKIAVNVTRSGHVGVIGTEGTIKSNAYIKAISDIDNNITVRQVACPLFVPLVEEGWVDNDVTKAAIRRYLGKFKGSKVDVLILGCTHYPLLKEEISRFVGKNITLIDSATATALETQKCLEVMGLIRHQEKCGVRSAECGVRRQMKGRRKDGKTGRRETGVGRVARHVIYTTDTPDRFTIVGSNFLGRELMGVKRVMVMG